MKSNRISDHIILILGAVFMLSPIWLIFASSTHDSATILTQGLQWVPGDDFMEVYEKAWKTDQGFTTDVTAKTMLINSMIMGLGFAIGRSLSRFALPMRWSISDYLMPVLGSG